MNVIQYAEPGAESGRIVAMVPLASLAALICVGIGVDFSGQTIAEQALRDQVSSCTRSSADWAAMTAAPAHSAVAAAYQCLSDHGLSGTASFADNRLTVTSSGVYQTKLLSIVAISQLPTRATSSADVSQGR